MDIQLPGKDGFALLGEIRQIAPRRHLRVVALTAHAMSGDRERAMQAGFDGYITKPIDIRAFPDLVERALAGETSPTDPSGRRTGMSNQTKLQPAPRREAGPARGVRYCPEEQAEAREAELREEEARRRARARGRPVMWPCAAAHALSSAPICGWSGRSGSSPRQPLPESVAVKEASLRIGMAGAAQHLERYRQKNGRLPAHAQGRRRHDRRHRLRAAGLRWLEARRRQRPARLTLTSQRPLTRFLGNSFEVISRRRSMSRRRGFTFIEVLVVMIVIGILATLGVLKYIDLKHRALSPRPWPTSGGPPGGLQRLVRAPASWPAEVGAGVVPPALTPYLAGRLHLLQAGVHAGLGQLRAPGRRAHRCHAARRGAHQQQCAADQDAGRTPRQQGAVLHGWATASPTSSSARTAGSDPASSIHARISACPERLQLRRRSRPARVQPLQRSPRPPGHQHVPDPLAVRRHDVPRRRRRAGPAQHLPVRLGVCVPLLPLRQVARVELPVFARDRSAGPAGAPAARLARCAGRTSGSTSPFSTRSRSNRLICS